MEKIMIRRVIEKLDFYLGTNDYTSAERHLKYWLSEGEMLCDIQGVIAVSNELIGLYRKLGKKEEAFFYSDKALRAVESADLSDEVAAATTYVNCGTAYKAFGEAERSLILFEKARAIYERDLSSDDSRLGAFYNNMALALVDVKDYGKAKILYEKALAVMKKAERGELECAITYLNMASAAEAEFGIECAESLIEDYVRKAWILLDMHKASSDGHYAFVCEKCGGVFGYYGYFIYEKELAERAKRIYEGN